jgi:DNA-binding CsgD family transcriptional regulator
MRKILFLLILLTNSCFCWAQSSSDSCLIVGNEPRANFEYFDILPDQNYSFERVLTDSTLPFTHENHILAAKTSDYYWVRCTVQNPSKYSKHYYISVFPFFDNTLYYYDDDAEKWRTVRNGFAVGNTAMRSPRLLPCLFQANQKSTFFVKISVQRLKTAQFAAAVKISLSILDAAMTDTTDAHHYWYWLIAMCIIAVFLCYNTYIYYLYKDDTHFHYFAILLGAMAYITGIHSIANVLWHTRIYNIAVANDGKVYDYDFNTLIGSAGALLVVVGFVQLTRSYFRLKTLQPKLDNVLKYAILIFTILRLVNMFVTISGIYYANNTLIQVENNYTIGLFLLLLYGSITAYRRGFKPAKYFLIAHAIPLILIILIAVLVNLYYSNQLGVFVLPDIVAVIQSFTCTIALVARVELAQAELLEQQLVAKTLRIENEQIQLRSQVMQLENERITLQMNLDKAEQTKLQTQLAFNQRELAATTMYLYQKSEMLLDLQKEIARLPKIAVHATSMQLIKTAIQNNTYLDADWHKFKLHFEQVHPNFFQELLDKHPNLTTNEVRLCAYFHLQLSTKEIAALLNINPQSVLTAKMRLNKKMNLPTDEKTPPSD